MTLPQLSHQRKTVSIVKKLVAPLGFTLLSAWVVVLFVLAHNTP
ncbi:hypothetical protein [Actinoplanes utahensis]|nr:hypothetical protein [Actinoplanes utahensis]